MIFRKQLKAGVLLYALLLTAVFSLLLQFYLLEVMANKREEVALNQTAKAQIMAELTRQQVSGDSGSLTFNLGTAHYQTSGDQVTITVTLENNDKRTFTYAGGQSSSASTSQQSSSSSASSTSSVGASSSSADDAQMDKSSDETKTSETKASETSKVPQDLVGRWQDATGTTTITYAADGTIGLQEDGREKSGKLTAYEEVSPGLYRVTSSLDDYVMPGGWTVSADQELVLGFKISGDTLTFVSWTGPKGSAFDASTYQLTESETSYQRQ